MNKTAFHAAVLTSTKIPDWTEELRSISNWPARPSRPRPTRVANRRGAFPSGSIARRFLWPCAAAALLGKTLSYPLGFLAFVLFSLH